MSSILGKIYQVEGKASVWDEQSRDIVQLALDNVAKDVEARVRSRADTGIDAKSAIRASAITVRNDEGQLVIRMGGKAKDDGSTDSSTDDLFHPSSEPPKIEDGNLVFRKLKEDQLKRRNETAVRSSVEDAMNIGFTDKLSEAANQIESENPGLKVT